MRIVIDSNVLIAAFATRGLCHEVFEAALGNCDIILSEDILLEVKTKLTGKLKVPKKQADEVADYLRESCKIARFRKTGSVCRDKKDNHVLWLAESNTVSYIVSGDKDLTLMRSSGRVKIISPRGFWEILSKK